jgi:hypothetical protein
VSSGNETKEKPEKLEGYHISQRRHSRVNAAFGALVPFIWGSPANLFTPTGVRRLLFMKSYYWRFILRFSSTIEEIFYKAQIINSIHLFR